MCGLVSVGEGGAVAAEVEHGGGDECLGGVEAVGHAGDQSDLGVGGLDQPVGQVVFDRGEDFAFVCHDAFLEFDECGDPAASGP